MRTLNEMYIREFNGSMYGEKIYPFDSDQEFDWFDPDNPTISEVADLLQHLDYDTSGVEFSPTGVDGIGITGDNIDIVIGFSVSV